MKFVTKVFSGMPQDGKNFQNGQKHFLSENFQKYADISINPIKIGQKAPTLGKFDNFKPIFHTCTRTRQNKQVS